MQISEILLELFMWQYPMSPSNIGIVALDIVPSLVILDAPHGSLKGWQCEDAQVALAWAIWCGGLVLCHDALAQEQERQGDVCLYLFRHCYCSCFAMGCLVDFHLAFFLLNISAIMAFTSSPTCTKFLYRMRSRSSRLLKV